MSKDRQPVRANPPICWLCDRKLALGGWSYVIIDGNHHAHRSCAESEAPTPTAQPTMDQLMPLTLQTDQSVANRASARWRETYFRNGRWDSTCSGSAQPVYEKLVALGPSPAPAEVARVIGNDTWSTAAACSACDKKTGAVVICGAEPEYESNTAYLCAGCLRAALTLIEGQR